MSGPEHTARSERAQVFEDLDAAKRAVERSKHDSTPPTFWPRGDLRRDELLAELEHYAAAWLPEILKRAGDLAANGIREPNAVMVPPGFAPVASGSLIAGLAVITPTNVEDWGRELPFVCYTILPKEST